MIKTLNQNAFIQWFYFKRSELDRILLLSCLFSIAMVCIRVVYTKNLLFTSFIWNLFLAYLPYAISVFAYKRILWARSSLKFALQVSIWLLFIPNSFYMITDLFHLKETVAVPYWFDLALIFSFAWNGLLLGIASVRHIEKVIEQQFQLKWELLFVYPVMLLNAFGIYLGRYLRFNSWDVISNPFSLANDMISLLIHPLRYRFDWSMIACFSVLMTLLYITLKRLSKTL